MAVGSDPEVGASFGKFPMRDGRLDMARTLILYAEWKRHVGEDLMGGYATTVYVDPNLKARVDDDSRREFGVGPFVED